MESITTDSEEETAVSTEFHKRGFEQINRRLVWLGLTGFLLFAITVTLFANLPIYTDSVSSSDVFIDTKRKAEVIVPE